MTREEMLNECVSRDKAIVQLNHLLSDWDDDWNIAIRKCIETIKILPSVTPPPCDDAVSRQAVLELVADYDLSMGQVVKGIHALPSVTPMPKWIPVSEMLPEVGSEVLVCYEFKKHRSVYIADFYGDGKFHGLDDEYLTTEGRKYRKAVAWMPLPQPYQSEIPTGAESEE